MSNTQQPEALNLEEFRAKVTRAAREPLLARFAELEAQLAAIGAGGVEPMHNREASAALAASDERKAFDAANLRDYFGGPLSYRERDIAFMAWQARAALSATPVADAGNPALESDVPVALPEPAAWLATFTPKGMLSPHSIAGTNLEELKRSVPSDSVFKPLYARHVSQELEQFIEQVGDVHFQRHPFSMDEEDDDSEYDCPHCAGTGEGQYDGQTCSVCRGKGVCPK